MSKIYNKYIELKNQEPDKMYLFKSGKFYIFLAEDCEKINQYVVLKKVKFTNHCQKCGFPENVLEDYLRVFKNHQLNIEIIEDFTLLKPNDLYSYIESLDMNKISPIEAFGHLMKIKEMVEREKGR